MLETWNGGAHRISDDEIVASIPFDIPLELHEGEPITRDAFFKALERSLIGVSTRIDETATAGEFTVTASAPARRIFELAGRAPNVEARRIELRGDDARIVFGQRRTKSVIIHNPGDVE